jgi:hypothetical protein
MFPSGRKALLIDLARIAYPGFSRCCSPELDILRVKCMSADCAGSLHSKMLRVFPCFTAFTELGNAIA